MTVICEGKLQFTFNTSTQACKYDDWAFYRNQFQNRCYRGNKAVDFLCYLNNEAWLIEVKDYCTDRRTKPEKLADEVAEKVRDTLAGLAAAQNQANNQKEKIFAQNILSKRRFRIVCHIEQPITSNKLWPQIIDPADLKQELSGLLKAIDPHPIVVGAQSIPSALPWRVLRIP